MEKRKISYRTSLGAGAELIIALIRKQPQTKEALCKVAKIHVSTFYRILPLLKERGIIKETEDGFALWTYVELEKSIEKALDELGKSEDIIPFDRIASEVGVHPSEIERIIYAMAKKRGMEVLVVKRQKAIAKKNRGAVRF